jgi:hypothetical protein
MGTSNKDTQKKLTKPCVALSVPLCLTSSWPLLDDIIDLTLGTMHSMTSQTNDPGTTSKWRMITGKTVLAIITR